jgi:hypothetical protein
MIKTCQIMLTLLVLLAAACQPAPDAPPAPALDVPALHTAAARTIVAGFTSTPTPQPSATATPQIASPQIASPQIASPSPAPLITSLPTMADVPIHPVSPGARVLEQPVAVVRGGIIMAVEQAAVYPERVELVYTIRNLPAEVLFDPLNASVETDCGGPDSYPSLRLPDGTLIPAVDYMLDGKAYDTINQPFARGYAIHLFRAAVPAEVQEMQMVLHCIALARLDRAPLDWVVPFRVR